MPKAVLLPAEREICGVNVKFYFYFTLRWLPYLHAIRIMSDRQGKILRQYRIILSADTASEVRQMLSQKRR